MLVGGSVSGQANAIYTTNVAICTTGALDGTAVTGNSLGNNNTGLYLKSATNVWVASNDSFGSSAYGFCATGICSGSTVTGNSVHNGEYGLVFDSAQGVAANGNRVYANRLFGLLALGVSHGTIVQGNTIAGNGTNISTASAIGGSFQTS
jgi:nitrous oxidase accessory protein NosD